uniref:Transposase n=1 Tax=Angiostrongylus cantonensis TaxID=6313 RepID=A0A0K0DF57_ANGCA
MLPDFTLNGTNTSECSGYVCLRGETNAINDAAPELSWRKRAAWESFKSIEGVVMRTKGARFLAHLFVSTVLPTFTYASETWPLPNLDERSLGVVECAFQKAMLGVSLITQVREGIRTSDFRQRSKIKDAVLYAKQSKIRWPGLVMLINDNRSTRAVSDWISRHVNPTAGKPRTR